MSQDIIFHEGKKDTNPLCILPGGKTRTYVSLNINHDVLIKDSVNSKYVKGKILAQRNKNATWYYRVQTMKFVKWCGPNEFKISPEK